MIADTTMARRGSPRTGFSACFGGPLFNLLLGIGLPFTIQLIQGGGSVISLGIIYSISQFILNNKFFLSVHKDDLGPLRGPVHQPVLLLHLAPDQKVLRLKTIRDHPG